MESKSPAELTDRLHPVMAAALTPFLSMTATLERAAVKQEPRRFTGEPITNYGDLDADAPDERLELEADMARDLRERSL